APPSRWWPDFRPPAAPRESALPPAGRGLRPRARVGSAVCLCSCSSVPSGSGPGRGPPLRAPLEGADVRGVAVMRDARNAHSPFRGGTSRPQREDPLRLVGEQGVHLEVVGSLGVGRLELL